MPNDDVIARAAGTGDATAPQLSEEMQQAITEVRDRLKAALDVALPGGYGARSLGRALKLQRMTAWRCWTVAHLEDPSSAIRVMPGKRAWATILKRCAESGAARTDIEALRAAVNRLESLIATRGVDRTVMRAVAGGATGSDAERAALVEARRTAALGTSKACGVHASGVAMAHLLAGGPSPSTLTLGTAVVFAGLVRNLPGEDWPIMRRSVACGGEDPSAGDLHGHHPLGDGGELPSVIQSVSSPGIVGAQLRAGTPASDFETISLCDVPAFRRQRLRVAVAEYVPSVDLDPTRAIEPIKLLAPVQLPADVLVCDVLIHRDLVRRSEPEVRMSGTPVVPELLTWWGAPAPLPLGTSMLRVESIALPERIAEAEGGYREALGRVAKAQGASLDHYDMFRVVVPYAPMFSIIGVNFELDEAARRSR